MKSGPVSINKLLKMLKKRAAKNSLRDFEPGSFMTTFSSTDQFRYPSRRHSFSPLCLDCRKDVVTLQFLMGNAAHSNIIWRLRFLVFSPSTSLQEPGTFVLRPAATIVDKIGAMP